jgi:transcriptional regulator with XRE-family HTH domain
MTVKELAQFTGKSETTVQRWVKKANCKMQLCNNKMQLQRGHETDFKLEEVEAILNSSSMSKDAVSILIDNAKKSQQRDCGSMLTQKDMAEISAVVSMTISQIMAPMNERISKLENGVNVLPEPEYYSIIGYANKHGVRVDIHGALELSKRAKQLSISEHKDIRKIPDERWGQVNSYSVSVLKELFEV